MNTWLNLFKVDTLLEGLHEYSNAQRRTWFLRACLLALVVSSLLFYGLYQPAYDHNIHLVAAVLYLLLLGALQRGVSYVPIAHLGFLISIVHIVWVAGQSGGINSVTMVWMTVVTLPATLLLSRLAAIFWGAVTLLVIGIVLALTNAGVLASLVDMSNELIAWTLVNKVLVACMAMAVVWLAERMHSQQVAQIDKSNQALEETHRALRQAQAHKDEFIASVGHELRTPMNAILGLNSLLRNELSAKAEDAEIVDHIRRSTEQLLRVVNDILDFSQLQAGHLSLREDRFELSETVQSVLDLWADKAQTKGLDLRLEDHQVLGLWVKGDRQRLIQVLRNLVDNAVKFTASGHVLVRVKSVDRGVLFEVEDTGIGIAAHRQQQVFNRFEHADAQTNRQYGGTGLGLSICERLVSLQGGRIGVSSVPGHATTFWFELPLSTVAAEDALSPQRLDQLTGRNLRILLVDDNAVNLMVARLMLKKFLPQAEITEANGGAVALDLLREQTFDLVLMDMVMPDVDGLQATRILRKNYPKPVCDVPVLGLTASTNPVDRDQCLEAGMDEVLHKPLDEEQLLAQLSRLAWPSSAQASP
jgi:signal transduction histidine kinase/ActR/RegA family two-component response regulator